MSIDKMINMLLIKLSQQYKVFYMEKRNYKSGEIYKTFNIKIGNIKEEFLSKRDLLVFLSEF